MLAQMQPTRRAACADGFQMHAWGLAHGMRQVASGCAWCRPWAARVQRPVPHLTQAWHAVRALLGCPAEGEQAGEFCAAVLEGRLWSGVYLSSSFCTS